MFHYSCYYLYYAQGSPTVQREIPTLTVIFSRSRYNSNLHSSHILLLLNNSTFTVHLQDFVENNIIHTINKLKEIDS